MFDAYTIKKVLPRLVIGVILIQLSWFLFTGMIQLVNALAWGLEALIYAPFGGVNQLESFSSMLSNLAGGNGTGTGLFLGLAGAVGAGFALGIAGIVSLALTAIVGLFIGFAVLILRQVVLLALLLVAPLALVAWILPGTEKIWKIWWESFSKLLLMFPMVVGLVAAGRVFASVASKAGTGGAQAGGLGTIIDVFIIVLGIFGPFFLIPKTFQLAGGAFANLTGMVNDRSRGFFDKQREKRKGYVAKNVNDFKAGDRFSRGGIAARAVNRVGAGVGAGWKGRYGVGKQGAAARARVAEVAAANRAKENEALNQLALNSDEGIAVLALSGGTSTGAKIAANQLREGWLRDDKDYQSALAKVTAGTATAADRALITNTEAKANQKRDRAIAAAGAVGFDRQNAQAAVTLMAQNKSRAVGAGDTQTIQAGIDRLHGRNAAAAEGLSGTSQYFNRQSGRFDIGGSDALDGGSKGSLYQLANAHPSTVAGMGQAHKKAVNDAAATHGAGSAQHTAALHDAAVFKQELSAMQPNATGANRDEIIRQQAELETAGVNGTYLNSASGRVDPATGAQRTVARKVTYDATDPSHAAWSPHDQSLGFRIEHRTETKADIAGEEARTYQRPDENNL